MVEAVEDVDDVLEVVQVLLDTVVIEVAEDDKGLATEAEDDMGDPVVKLGLKHSFSLLGVANKSSLETASMRPMSVVLSVLGEAALEVVTSAKPLVLESGFPLTGEFIAKSGLVLES